MPPLTRLFIDGDWKDATTGDTFEVRNPFTNDVVGLSASASSDDCKSAVEASGRAFITWEHAPIAARRNVFLRAAELIATEKYSKRIVGLHAEETAATPAFSAIGVAGCLPYILNAAVAERELKGDTFPSSRLAGGHVLVQKRAMGVILAISPWNAPSSLSLRAICIPIMCGNTVVLKSSEYSPASQALVVELFQEAGLPKGVLNFISMSRESAPALTAEIIAHPLVRKINFTGSDRVGRILAMEAAKHLKPCVFELGGKAPAVVLNDANVLEAAKAIVSGGLLHSGQICMSTERVIVQRGVSDTLMAAVSELSNKVKAGGSGSQLSALFSKGSADNVISMIKEAQEAGAEVIVGNVQSQGAVVQPHIVTGVKPGMRLWERESFGPVIAFDVVDTLDEAVEAANNTTYSLSASLWTSDVNTALDVAPRIRAGYTNVNGGTFHSEPLEGVRGLGGSSGYGGFGVDDFTDKRLIIVHPEKGQYPLVD